MSMHVDDFYSSRFVSAADLKAAETVVIEKVENEDFSKPGEPSKPKPVLYFKGKSKGLVLNKTNSSALADTLGKDMSKWIGIRIQLRPERTTYGGKPTPCIRTYHVEGEVNGRPVAAPAAARKPEPEAAPIVDDDIPW
jgi:hypothetical protein